MQNPLIKVTEHFINWGYKNPKVKPIVFSAARKILLALYIEQNNMTKEASNEPQQNSKNTYDKMISSIKTTKKSLQELLKNLNDFQGNSQNRNKYLSKQASIYIHDCLNTLCKEASAVNDTILEKDVKSILNNLD